MNSQIWNLYTTHNPANESFRKRFIIAIIFFHINFPIWASVSNAILNHDITTTYFTRYKNDFWISEFSNYYTCMKIIDTMLMYIIYTIFHCFRYLYERWLLLFNNRISHIHSGKYTTKIMQWIFSRYCGFEHITFHE